MEILVVARNLLMRVDGKRQIRMATICKECGGIIPDIIFNTPLIGFRDDCKNHDKGEININIRA